MSKLQELIRELCPDGVEYKRLEEVSEFRAGWGFPESEQGKTNGKYPFYKVSDMNSSDVFMDVANNYISEETSIKLRCKPAPKGTIIFPKIGATMGTNKKRILTKDSCYDNNVMGLIAKSSVINDMFLYYYFSRFKLMDFAKGTGAVPSLDTNKLKKFLIPVPPLEVQKEIVRILDYFTNLAAELQAELQARKEQYEYYRYKLLIFNNINGGYRTGVTWMKMSEIGNICMCKRIMKEQTNNIGGVPFYKIGTFGKVADAYISRELYEDYKNRFSFPVKGEVLISASGTIGRSVIYDGEDAYFQDSNIVWVHNDETKVLNKYLYHYYRIIEWNVEGGTIKRLYNSNLAKTKIAVPSLPEQERIVNILDKFENLTTDLQTGLPAEIAAVQEQYEYYRNKLLSFPRTKISA